MLSAKVARTLLPSTGGVERRHPYIATVNHWFFLGGEVTNHNWAVLPFSEEVRQSK